MFQNAIQHALQGLNGVKNIVDDMIVWGRTQKEHDDNLQALLQRLRDTGLSAKKSKCLFNVDSLWFYSMILSKNGIRPDQEKVVAIKNTPAPNNVKELHSFLGLVNYCSKFIPNFSTITALLWKLDRKKVPWTWDASHQEAFDQVKSSLSEQCTLAYYDPNRSTSVDALKGKVKSKQYVDTRRHTRKSTIKEGDIVLVKQKKKNKYTTMFRPQPYKVVKVRYSRVTAQRGDHVITRNILHFKKFSGVYRETVPKPESEDNITIAAPQAGQDNDQDIIGDMYPLRANRGIPPDFYGR